MEQIVDVVYQFRAYTTKDGYQQLDNMLLMHKDLYNAALEERKTAWNWRQNGGNPELAMVNYFSQCKELTAIRADDKAWEDQSRRLATGTLKRLDRAYEAFFRRVKNGETPGHPRFRSGNRYRTLETHGVEPAMLKVYPDKDQAAVRLKGLPLLTIKLKGRQLPPVSQFTSLKITRKGRRCTVSLGFKEAKVLLPATNKATGLDMRLNVGRVVSSDGWAWTRRDDRRQKEQKRLQRKVSRARRGSNNRKKKVQIFANFEERESLRNHNHVHRFTTHVVRHYDLIALEDLDILGMTRTGKGNIENPGTSVKLKADLNRRIREQTWGKIRQQLTYKAEWAGREVVAVDPAFTSRTCSTCGAVRPSPQIAPVFRCLSCGITGAAAHNAAVNILRLGLRDSGKGGNTGLMPSLDTPLDVAPIGALVPMRVELPACDTS